MSDHSGATTLSVALVEPERTSTLNSSTSGSQLIVESIEIQDTIDCKTGRGHEKPILARVTSQQSVLKSEDILPMILLELRADILNSDQSPSDHAIGTSSSSEDQSPRWRASFLSLLLVDKSFLQAASNLLWNTMETLAPVFKLLPWYTKTPKYMGLGSFKYSGSIDWERFNFYASRIQRFHLKYSPEEDFSIPWAWLLQLFTLHERPDPLFPILQSIIVTPNAFPGLPVLFLLVGPSLRSLELFSCSKIFDYGNIPPDWEACARESQEASERAQENLIAVLPRVSMGSPQLQSLTYQGPLSDDLFHQFSQLKGLVSMHLTMVDRRSGLRAPIECFSKLKSLKHLVLEAPLIQTTETSETSLEHPFVMGLNTLKVMVNSDQHTYFQNNVHFNRLQKLSLEFTGQKASALSFHLIIKDYLRRSRELESLSIAFIPGRTLAEDGTIEQGSMEKRRHKEEKKARAYSANAMSATDLKQVHMMNVPPSMMKSIASVLRIAMSSWPHLKILRFCVQGQSTSSILTEKVSSSLPGVRFLGNTVWKSCPELEELEFHFDEDIIAQETLMASSTLQASSSREHPLRILRINTSSSTLDLDLRKKIEIATFLDRLFPGLDILRGSALNTWEEVEMLVKSYQGVKEHVYARIEAL